MGKLEPDKANDFFNETLGEERYKDFSKSIWKWCDVSLTKLTISDLNSEINAVSPLLGSILAKSKSNIIPITNKNLPTVTLDDFFGTSDSTH